MKELIPLESEEQQSLFQWADVMSCRYPEMRMLYHVPNGGYRNKSEAARLTAEGVRRGVPDVCLPVARGDYHGLYIELKRRKNSVVSEDQRRWINSLLEQGYQAQVCYGWIEAKEAVLKYLKGQAT
ncbi:VRR-NUC domain-containing protein [Sporobacter termitidis DSM 10068]|uniref:VRR-NUC domain-containing protein n=1 Tax=Sporobacter termitidis DSM 10068 TaxID=1123282 RepID=A0A1M5ZHV0_9FIRM|nr:VRR-NUC domain-containing protein [Sporobacter termitidis]SHI23728.1 VRR-NUC domain-containing protein [Sporobacter termitidis DSM 10068]SHI24415.1 VRR-NUC domain-containing protein [Sporobacter termitidis DSM 10068]